METELLDYLGDITTPENQKTLGRAASLLSALGTNAHYDDIDRILQTVEVQETQQNLLDLFTLLTVYSGNVIQSFGIEVSEELPLHLLNEILEAFTILPNYGDPEHLLTILEGVEEVGAEETLCELLEVMSPKEWHVFAPYVENVSDAFLERLREVCGERLPPEEEKVDISPQRDRLLNLGAIHTRILAMEWLRQGGHFNTSLDTLIIQHEEDLGVIKRPAELALELVGLMLVSDVPFSSYQETIKDLLDDLVEDPFEITKIYNESLTLLKEIDLEKA